MKKMLSITKFAILSATFVLVALVVSASAQAKKIDSFEKSFTDFSVKAEMWGDVIKDANGNEQGFKNCRIRMDIKNTSGGNIGSWVIEAKMNKDPKGSGSYEDISRRESYISAGTSTERIFGGYCYMKKDSLKIYKK